ncbi:MAG: biopolymer transporter ExbD [Bacteriovoracaceae bacterium]|nr:biopolymer transporter ExbD [Bacteriovoracaceae bacterium]
MGLKAKRELNSDLNLTPFIDLLSTLVCFLLISAVWIQVASMDLKQSHGTDSGAPKETAALDVVLGEPGSATVILKKGSKTLNRTQLKEASNKELVTALQKTVVGLKNLPAMKNSNIESVLVAPHAKVIHGDMVSVLDGFRLNGIMNIGVKPSAGEK